MGYRRGHPITRSQAESLQCHHNKSPSVSRLRGIFQAGAKVAVTYQGRITAHAKDNDPALMTLVAATPRWDRRCLTRCRLMSDIRVLLRHQRMACKCRRMTHRGLERRSKSDPQAVCGAVCI